MEEKLSAVSTQHGRSPDNIFTRGALAVHHITEHWCECVGPTSAADSSSAVTSCPTCKPMRGGATWSAISSAVQRSAHIAAPPTTRVRVRVEIMGPGKFRHYTCLNFV
jgi:hypothetical protein